MLGINGAKPPGGTKSFTATRRKKAGSTDVKGLQANCIVEGSTFSSFLPKDGPKITGLSLEHITAEKYTSGRNFLLNKGWKNEPSDFKYNIRDKRFSKPNSFIPPLPQDHLIHRFTQEYRLALHKKLSHSPSKPIVFGSCDGYGLTSVPAILLPTTSLSVRKPDFSEAYRNRPRINSRPSMFTISAHQKYYIYADPICGASPSYVQRLSDMSCLEGETVRQEKMKKLKKNKTQEP